MTKIVTALEARKNLGEILNRAYYSGEVTIIERKGKTIARIVPPVTKAANINSILSFSGTLTKKDAAIIKQSATARKSDNPKFALIDIDYIRKLEEEVQKIYGKTFIDPSQLPLTREFNNEEIERWQQEDRL